MGSEQTRFLQPQQPPEPRRKRWGGCWGGFTCLRKQKGGKRIVPASRMPEVNALSNQANGQQAGGLPNQTTGLALSLLAPPSSPASLSNSALPSTAQSPSCYLSANSPGGPSSNMFVTGPYAHETQPVSPPVFSTFTTEPSTAPLTPPPELAHLTTPSSPDVPYAHFLSSTVNLKSSDKTSYITGNDLQATYSLYPGSPASTLRSPVSRMSSDNLSSSFPEREFPPRWDPSMSSQDTKFTNSDSAKFLGLQPTGASKSRQDSNFFCPETFAQFYLDQSSFSHTGGRLSISKESDAYSNGGNGYQNWQIKTCKADAEELEAYRASFGFSADEIITTNQYVEISDVLEDSFSMTPFTSEKPVEEEHILTASADGPKIGNTQVDFPSPQSGKAQPNRAEGSPPGVPGSCNGVKDHVPQWQPGDVSAQCTPGNQIMSDDDCLFSKTGATRNGRKYISNSDAEIEYRRGRSLREARHLR